ncbi:TM2 domain-containing protein [bacterium]|nr:TM2 domain-containing protein [bacterium]
MRAQQTEALNREKALLLALTASWLGGHRFRTGQTFSAMAAASCRTTEPSKRDPDNLTA